MSDTAEEIDERKKCGNCKHRKADHWMGHCDHCDWGLSNDCDCKAFVEPNPPISSGEESA